MSIPQVWWGRRRAEPEPVMMGNEAGMVPFSFEPEETLGDTGPMPLGEPPRSAAQAREDRNHRRMYLLVAAVALGLYFGHLA